MSRLVSEHIDSAIKLVVAEVARCTGQVSGESLAQAGDMIEVAPRIFVTGAGRSGLCMRAFAMRLMHLGKTVYVVGDTTTPSITSKDLLILGTGSGQSVVLLKLAEQAQQQGAKILLFTAEASSPLSKLADHLVMIPAPSLKPFEVKRSFMSTQPMGSLFEQSLLILCDSLIFTLMDHIGVGAGKMRKHHANLE
jgi:6-phospho-3-hexuloisomerase